jgi:cardiolipin synthase
VSVTVVTPQANNIGFYRDTMILHGARSGFEVRFYPGRMTHMKALLVDGETLVVGSANFETLSYRFQQEFIVIVTDPDVVGDFTRRVVEEDLRRSPRCEVTLGYLAQSRTRVHLAAIDVLSALWRRALPRTGA